MSPGQSGLCSKIVEKKEEEKRSGGEKRVRNIQKGQGVTGEFLQQTLVST